jgi:hypothetical protein
MRRFFIIPHIGFRPCIPVCAGVIALFFISPAQAQDYDNSPILFMNNTASAVQAVKPSPTAGAAQPVTSAEKPAQPAIRTESSVLPKVPPLPPNFPEWAVSNAGQNTAGNTNPVIDSPASPSTPAAPHAAPVSITPATPIAPPAPESPASALWPRDTVPIFVKSCVGFHVELIPACTCVITELMATMAHDEFLELSANNKIESNPRLKRARLDCVAAPARKE